RHSGEHLVCYRVKLSTLSFPQNGCGPVPGGSGTPITQAPHARRLGMYVNNQFGPERFDTVKERELCLPSALPATSTTTTSTSTTSTTSTTLPCGGVGCCGPERISLVSTVGTLRVDNLAPFPVPMGVVTTMDTGPALGAPTECRHDAVIPAGGFV